MKKTILALFGLAAAVALNAEITMPKIFSDNMVLQCGEPVKIWGKALPNAKVAVKFADISKSVKADEFGKWSLCLPAMKPNCKDRVMHISENGVEQKVIKNVLVGQVWIAGGQSNMQFSLKETDNAQEAMSRANYPLMRAFIMKYSAIKTAPAFDVPEGANWRVCTPKTAGGISAVAFFFAEKIMKELNVPVGIVETELGGAKMVAFLERQDAKGVAGFDKQIAKFDKLAKTYDYQKALENHKKALAKFNAEKASAKKAGKKFTKHAPLKPLAEGPMRQQEMPQFLYNAKIAPIAGYAAKGFLWYQGESDATDPTLFAGKFERLIKSWRKYWGKSDMPFYFVQLTSFSTRANWPVVREQQRIVADKMKNVEMAVTIDVGMEKDIHPKNKYAVGLRLAKIALKNVYGQKHLKGAYGPIAKSVDFNGNSATVNFELSKVNMTVKNGLRGVEILVDNSWEKPAGYKFSANGTLVVNAEKGDTICGVRYLQKNWAQPDVCLYNLEGTPAAPFIFVK